MAFYQKVALIFSPLNEEKIKYPFLEFNRFAVYPPLGLLSLAAYLKKKEAKTKIDFLDGYLLSLEEIKKQLKKIQPDLVGLSPLWCSYENTLEIARFVKSWNAKVILGGHHATGLAREILINRGPISADYCVDAVVQQDGEEALCQIVRGMPFYKIPNLIYLDKKEIKYNPIRLTNLDELPSAGDLFSLINVHDYYRRQRLSPFSDSMSLSLYSRKGCRWHTLTLEGCLFCSRMEKEWRIKSPQKFGQELIETNKYRPDFIFEASDDFFDNIDWLEKLWELGADYPPLSFMTRADRINENSIKLIKKFQVSRVILGLESGDNAMLANFKKGTNVDLNKRAVKIVNNSGIPVRAYFVLGAPGETKGSLENTLKLAMWIKKNNKFNTLLPQLLHPLPNSIARDLLIQKTDKKYLGKDLIFGEEIIRDWIKIFCRVNWKDISKIFDEINNLNYFKNDER